MLSRRPPIAVKGHLAMLWVVELARNPFMLDAVEDLIGPDIMVFGASIFAKGGKDRAYVSRHQDNAYFGLEPHEEITAWVAFTQTSAENGALQVLPRTPTLPTTCWRADDRCGSPTRAAR
jgi:non-heme Fe2+,alpha-ketoglutarate-dependent halogenase